MTCTNKDAVGSSLLRKPAIAGQGCTYCADASEPGEAKRLGSHCSFLWAQCSDWYRHCFAHTADGKRCPCWPQEAVVFLLTQSRMCYLIETRRYSMEGGLFSSAEALGRNRFFVYIEVLLVEQPGRAEHAF